MSQRQRVRSLSCLGVGLAVLSMLLPAPTLRGQEAVSPLPPAVTRSLYRSRWFEFLNAHLDDDAKAAAAALAEMRKAARTVGVSRLSDFSRTAVHEGRKAEAASRPERAARAYAAARELDETNLDALISQIGFLFRQHKWSAATALLPEILTALLATQESRLALLSSFASWFIVALAAALLAWIIVLLVEHFPRVAHDIEEASGQPLGSRAAGPLV